jgi:predicted glycogen debranching enzyme
MPLPKPITIAADVLHGFDQASRLEWLETDGLGGYSSGTVTGANTRRYHGILVTARKRPADRVVLLSRLDETIVTSDGDRFDLSANYYPDTVHPQGHLHLETFRLDPWPTWEYAVGPLRLTKKLFQSRELGAVIVEYEITGGSATLELRPIVAGRDFHALVHENSDITRSAELYPGKLRYRAYAGIPELVIAFGAGEWESAPAWYNNVVYPRETERGLDDREDLFCPGVLRVSLWTERAERVAISTEPLEKTAGARADQSERARREDVSDRVHITADEPLAGIAVRLALAADAFVVQRAERKSIIAGYPWFADWGRDAMIALPGLCITTNRREDARAVLHTFAEHCRDGLIPNRFPDSGAAPEDADYNTADASLWFVEAVAAALDAGVRDNELWRTATQIIAAYERGTRFGIRMTGDGLVRQGEAGLQLTWMDARVGDRVITARAGRAVEINALWYNALRRAATLARVFAGDAAHYTSLADRAASAFDAFWNEEAGYLYDVLDDDGNADASFRPNQLIALSLQHSCVSRERALSIVKQAEERLLVPFGVRTLAPEDPRYVGGFEGPPGERDVAYHNGAAWPWLLGPFGHAYLRAHGADAAARERIRGLLLDAEPHLRAYGLGFAGEIVSGDPPHALGGCIAQAWSCGELLRLLAEVARTPGGD